MASSPFAEFTVHHNPEEYATFPSLQRHPSGTLYITYRCAPNDHEGYTHIDVRSVALLKRSQDGGESWQPIGEPIPGHLPRAGLQDPSLTILHDGTFLLTYFHWRYQPDHPEARSEAVMEGVWVRRSTDEGESWSEPVHVPVAENREMAVSEPAIELSDGTLLLPGYRGLEEGGEAALISRSGDGGRSWSAPAIIAHDPTAMLNYQEPALLDLGQGHILCVMRVLDRTPIAEESDSSNRRGVTAWMYQSHSFDGGESWQEATRTEMYGHPPNLIRLRDGRILCTYGYRRQPFGIRAALSSDEGQTWDVANEVVLRTDGAGADLGYPSSVELENGSILSSYYIHTADNLNRRIAVSRWQVAEAKNGADSSRDGRVFRE